MSWWDEEEVAKREKAQKIYEALFPKPQTAQEVADAYNIRGTIKQLL